MKKKEKNYFIYFKNFIGIHMYGYIIINFLIGLLDGFGLAMFIPLLSIATNTKSGSGESLGNLQFLLDGFTYFGLEVNLVNALILMVVLFILKGILYYLRIIYFTKIRLVGIRKIRMNLVNGLQNLSYSGFTQMEAGKIQNNMVGETARLINAMSQYFNVIQHLIMLITYLLLAYLSNWEFAIMVAVGAIISNIFFRYINKLTKEYSRKLTAISNNFNGNLIQSINNFKYLKATNYFKYYGEKLRKNISLAEEINFNLGKIGAIAESLREPIIIVIIAVVIIIQVNVMHGNFASILVSLLLFYRSLAHLVTLQNSWNNFLAASAGIDSIDNLLHEFDNHKEPYFQNKIENIENINVSNIDLSFGSQHVLNNISLQIRPKTSIAFVGESGAGKTTLANVICGLQPVDSGIISINGKSLYQSDLNYYRDKVGYITQEAVIFDDTIFNNVSFWDQKNDVTLKKFNDVMEMVSMKTFLDQIDTKEDTPLGNNGILVSGGQKQRISIARELYKNVELLILDEATSALDSQTEKHIKDNIDLLQGKCTIVIIAHRLSTIKNVDVIYLLEKGQIKDFGNFAELLEKSEHFRRMVELQEFQSQ